MVDLFSQNYEQDSDDGMFDQRSPLAVRMRPQTLNDLVGQEHLLKPGSPIRVLAEADEDTNLGIGPSSIILWGPPGTGKTTLAHVISRGSGRKFVELSAVTSGVKDVRAVMEQALTDRDVHGITTILFLDEIHRFNKAQQDALLPGVENRWVVLIAATTENPTFSVVSPLLSRSLLIKLKALKSEHIEELIKRALTDERGLNKKFTISTKGLDFLVKVAGSDARQALTILEASASVALHKHHKDKEIALKDCEQAIDQAALKYDRSGDQHYNVISAFIKSVRGSDVDAALHYAARMLESGEDPRFIARRLMILAAEDIGLADPTVLQTATAAAQAVQLVGMPEARIILAEAIIHAATAPKSNAVYLGIDNALKDVRVGKGRVVPNHLRDTRSAEADKTGTQYKYAHDSKYHVVNQQYLPDDLVNTRYYQPTNNGFEDTIGQRLMNLDKMLGKNSE
ncbi:MAG: replication-associated recombination protein A [Micrococcaceae bacterium]